MQLPIIRDILNEFERKEDSGEEVADPCLVQLNCSPPVYLSVICGDDFPFLCVFGVDCICISHTCGTTSIKIS